MGLGGKAEKLMEVRPLHRNEADLENNKASGSYQGTEIAIDQFVEHVIGMKSQSASAKRPRIISRAQQQMSRDALPAAPPTRSSE
jgi:hypothetical protein